MESADQSGQNKFQTLLVALVYLGVALFVGYLAARHGLSYYYADAAKQNQTWDEAQKALDFDDSNPEIYKVASHILLDADEHARAAELLEKGVALKPNDFLMWLRLGYARGSGGDLQGARAAYEKALQLAPDYSQTNRYLGRLMLKQGEFENAFRHLGRAAELEDEIYQEALHLARRQFPNDGAAIERALSPETKEGKKALAFYLIKHSLVTGNVENFIPGDSLDEKEKKEFIDSLVRRGNYGLARRVWGSLRNNRRLLEKPVDEMVVDGGFEMIDGSDESGFAWQVNPKISDASVSVDNSEGGSSNRVIQILLKGKVQLGAKILSQTVIVEPEQNYQLRFSLQAKEIVSNGGLAVFVADAQTNQLLGQSAAFKVTNGKWEPYQFNFRAGRSRAVYVFVQRLNCTTSPCPIFADASLDDFSMKKLKS